MSNPVIQARLEIISAKAKLLAEKYKNNQLWDGELSKGLDEIQSEISYARGEEGWGGNSRGWQAGDR